MRALCTGTSGTSKGRFLTAFQSFAARQGKAVHILDVGEEMITEAQNLLGDLPKAKIEGKILDLPRSAITQLRSYVMRNLLDRAREISEKKEDSLLATHVSFRWTRALTRGLDLKHVAEYNADRYFTVTATPQDISGKLHAHPGWGPRNVTEADIETWQQEEIHSSRLIAGFHLKPYLVFKNDPSADFPGLFDFLYDSKSTGMPAAPRGIGAYETIFVTAMSGVGARHYLEAFVRHASISHGRKEIGVLDIGQKVVKCAQAEDPSVSEHNILDKDDRMLNKWRSEAWSQLIMERDQYKDCIVLSHACFRDAGKIRPAYDAQLEGEMMRVLNPTIFMTFIDNALATKIRMFHNDHWRAQNISLRDVVIWRDEETFFTRLMAQYQERPHYVVTIQQPFESLYRLVFQRQNVRGVYLSYPITQILDDKGKSAYLERKSKLRDDLRESYVVYDPFDIRDSEICKLGSAGEDILPDHMTDYESLSQENDRVPTRSLKVKTDDGGFHVEGTGVGFSREEAKEFEPYSRDQIVERDYTFIDQSAAIVVYYPVEKVSAGVLAEITYGYSHGRDVFTWWVPNISPFLARSTTTPPGVFRDGEALLSYMKKEYCRE